ncbi:MAG: TIGR03905 family TSCPD domain-containing protein [Eubacteriales bacterium]|nr:TIGR03905 family TSCPD domain-containing protein [Eubacteriales bacterium]
MHYQTRGTCSSAIDLEIENGVITACSFTGGCRGNTTGLATMVIGQRAEDVMHRLRGIPCQGSTSCPDQLSHAIEKYLAQNQQ